MPDDPRPERLERLPSPFLLRCAARVLSIVGGGHHRDAEVRASYRATPSGGLLSSDDLLLAERWLVDQGWLTRDGAILSASARSQALPTDEAEVASELVRATILDSPPTWLGAVATRGEVRPEFLPQKVERVFSSMFSVQERDAILLAASVKFDEAALRALGDAGEEAVAVACRAFLEEGGRADLAAGVRRVSLISDALGYDISAPDLAGRECRIEVKSYRGRYPSMYITRNEFEVGLTLPRWYLVLCRSTSETAPEVVGWTDLAPLRRRMPVDVDRSARWQVARVRIAESELRLGLPLSPRDAVPAGQDAG